MAFNHKSSLNGIPLSMVHPTFLHSNSTSHPWAFGAIAELIDNSYDPDARASSLLIDKVDINGRPCLVFLDNGAGMDYDKLRNMLSFGFSKKIDMFERSYPYKPIGHYGNGFKSGSMRLGKDALVFTRCRDSAGVGFLSQTFLERTGADCVMVPIVEYTLPGLTRSQSLDTRNCLKAILEYSIYKDENLLLDELRSLENSITGTKIIIFNLREQDGLSELDFASDKKDIRCPEVIKQDTNGWEYRPIVAQTSNYKTSLREYCRILFLHARMKIILRGANVRFRKVSKALYETEVYKYKPIWLDKPVKIIIGFSTESNRTEDYGILLYHKNRLIKAYKKVGHQKEPNEKGVGVVGVAEVDFFTTTHNKQDFIPDDKFRSAMMAFGKKLNDYWIEKMESDDLSRASETIKNPDCLWVQCDLCLKWRRQPPGTLSERLQVGWCCQINQDPTHNRCDIPEEPYEENEILVVKRQKTKNIAKKPATGKRSSNNLEEDGGVEKEHIPSKKTLRHYGQLIMRPNLHL